MRIRRFNLPSEESALSDFLSDDDLIIYSKNFLPTNFDMWLDDKPDHGKMPCIDDVACYVVYDYKSLTVDEEISDVASLIRKARVIKNDEEYATLKNATQRELFLLSKYKIPSSDAVKIVELLKDEMKNILGAG